MNGGYAEMSLLDTTIIISHITIIIIATIMTIFVFTSTRPLVFPLAASHGRLYPRRAYAVGECRRKMQRCFHLN